MTCRSVEEKCFTQVVSKGKSYEAVLRGCRTGCVGSADTTCCEVGTYSGRAFCKFHGTVLHSHQEDFVDSKETIHDEF